MQKQLKYTSLALRDRPAAALAHFQKTLGRPSYFLTSTPSNHWVVLLGPRTSAPTAKVLIPAALPVPAPVKKAFPGWVKRLDRIPSQVIRFAAVSWEVLRQWLMHPVIDSRDSLQDDSVR